MLLPDKHMSLAESLIGLGGIVLGLLNSPKSVDQIYAIIAKDQSSKTLRSKHTYDTTLLAVMMLYAIGAVEPTESGSIRKCG